VHRSREPRFSSAGKPARVFTSHDSTRHPHGLSARFYLLNCRFPATSCFSAAGPADVESLGLKPHGPDPSRPRRIQSGSRQARSPAHRPGRRCRRTIRGIAADDLGVRLLLAHTRRSAIEVALEVRPTVSRNSVHRSPPSGSNVGHPQPPEPVRAPDFTSGTRCRSALFSDAGVLAPTGVRRWPIVLDVGGRPGCCRCDEVSYSALSRVLGLR
jgi:hypothetical protein